MREGWKLFFVQVEDGIRGRLVTGVQACALPITIPGLIPQWIGWTRRFRFDVGWVLDEGRL